MVLAGKNNSPISIGRPTPAYTCRNLFGTDDRFRLPLCQRAPALRGIGCVDRASRAAL
jgi:hypothetical protein